MPIVEKTKKIEFIYEPKEGTGQKLNVEIDTVEGDIIRFRNVKNEGEWTECSIPFIVEVVDFLKKKGIVYSQVSPEKPQSQIVSSGSGLSVPIIGKEKEDTSQEKVDLRESDSAEPLTSLSFGGPSKDKTKTKTEISEEIIKRPVIKSQEERNGLKKEGKGIKRKE